MRTDYNAYDAKCTQLGCISLAFDTADDFATEAFCVPVRHPWEGSLEGLDLQSVRAEHITFRRIRHFKTDDLQLLHYHRTRNRKLLVYLFSLFQRPLAFSL